MLGTLSLIVTVQAQPAPARLRVAPALAGRAQSLVTQPLQYQSATLHRLILCNFLKASRHAVIVYLNTLSR